MQSEKWARHLTLLTCVVALYFLALPLLFGQMASWTPSTLRRRFRLAEHRIIGHTRNAKRPVNNYWSTYSTAAPTTNQTTTTHASTTTTTRAKIDDPLEQRRDIELDRLLGFRDGYTGALRRFFSGLDWKGYRGSREFSVEFAEQLFADAVDLLARDWRLPIRVKTAPKIAIDCASPEFANLLTGGRRSESVRIVDYIVMSHEIDMLEIRLYELDSVVDEFVIFESSRTHRGLPKPYYFNETLARPEGRRRFEAFMPKIRHYMANESDYIDPTSGRNVGACPWNADCWLRIEHERKLIWRKFAPVERENTLVLHGDLDELISASALAHIKHCQPHNESWSIHGNLVFYVFSLRRVFFSDFPTSSSAYSLHFPVIAPAASIGPDGSLPRELPRSREFPSESGAHLNYMFGPLYLALKTMSLGEGGELQRYELLREGDFHAYWQLMANGTFNVRWFSRVRPAEQYRLDKPLSAHPARPLYRPWLIELNRHRYRDLLWNGKDNDNRTR